MLAKQDLRVDSGGYCHLCTGTEYTALGRRRHGACPASLPCGSYKALELLHLCREFCMLRSAFFLLAFPHRRLQ